MNDQFAGRYQCLPIRSSGHLITLQNEHSLCLSVCLSLSIYIYIYVYIYMYIYIYICVCVKIISVQAAEALTVAR
jgi:hypothetical protein